MRKPNKARGSRGRKTGRPFRCRECDTLHIRRASDSCKYCGSTQISARRHPIAVLAEILRESQC